MPETTNPRLLFNEYPTGYPIPGTTTVYDDTQKIDLDVLPNGGVLLLKVLVLSVDPYQRARMNRPIPGSAGYIVSSAVGTGVICELAHFRYRILLKLGSREFERLADLILRYLLAKLTFLI
jgi:NADPH-dependent curcumin reductase CurA